MVTTPQNRTITLTARPPVRIVERDWPVVAIATGDSYGGGTDEARHEQALKQGELDRYTIRVRQHADGRNIVYGVLVAGTTRRVEDRRGGELLAADEDLAAAIRRVGEDCGLPDGVIRECIADLPAEEI